MKGFIFWFFTCLAGSFLQTFLLLNELNSTGVFRFELIDFLALGAILSLICLLASTPLILVFSWLSIKNTTKMSNFFYHNFSLFLFFIIVYFILLVFYEIKMDEISEMLIPYAILSIITLNTYLLLYRSSRRYTD